MQLETAHGQGATALLGCLSASPFTFPSQPLQVFTEKYKCILRVRAVSNGSTQELFLYVVLSTCPVISISSVLTVPFSTEIWASEQVKLNQKKLTISELWNSFLYALVPNNFIEIQ